MYGDYHDQKADSLFRSTHLDHGTVAEVGGEQRGVDSGRHEDDAQVGVRVCHVAEQDQGEVRVGVTFVYLRALTCY